MSDGDLRGRVLEALAGVRHPATGRDVVESGHVQGLEVGENGDVRFSFGIQADDPGGSCGTLGAPWRHLMASVR